jgi:xanthine dehydrogenase accessory factor
MTMTERVQQLRHSRTPFVHATVVRAQQPTSAHAGDQAIMLSDGTIEGFVGGHCAQGSVRKAALGALQAGESVLLRVLPDGDVHFPEAPGACVVVNPCLSGGALEIFLAPQVPAPLVHVCGATPIAEVLAAMTAALGYEVQRDGDADLTQAAAVVIATHGGPEAEMIRAALDAGVGYVGLVASKVRGGAIVDALALTDAERRRVHTPVGLPIGAKTPAEIAVSILAEVVQAIRVEGLTAPSCDAATGHVPREEACHGHG